MVAILGSVAIPARQTWRITRLLRETTAVLAPARLIEAELHAGLAKELTALQRYALTGDTAMLEQFRAAAADDERRLAALKRLAARLGAAPTVHVDVLGQRIDGWRRTTGARATQSGTRAQIAATFRAGQAQYDAALSAFAGLSSDLAANAAARDDRVRALEHLSLAINAALVLAALVAMGGVTTLTLRERRLTATLRARVGEARRRARQEAALREAAEALAGAYSVDEVTQRVAQTALAALEVHGAFVERIVSRSGELADVAVVQAVAGADVPPLGTTRALAGSFTEQVTASGQSLLIADLHQPERAGAAGAVRTPGGSAIAVPLGGSVTPMGALFAMRATGGEFDADDVARAGIFGHLATLAFDKVRLLEDAFERRRVLERVMKSRSRLMRGFSHDVKNPIGAADGFADLLSLGVYGELSAQQQASVERMRGCLHGALALIDDLHELARAETGILTLSSEPVNVVELVRTICDEYHAAARAAGLSLSVEVALDLPLIDTDRVRVRQIVANLLSNAIKYTERGTVVVRASHRPTGASNEAGDWALIEVVDTGLGIPAHQQDVIFEEFSRLGSGEHRGAGLGLAISKLLAEALGGRITVQSVPGQGSTFTLWLPLHQPAARIRASPAAGAPTYVRTGCVRPAYVCT
ncbi:ATP-binding region ATPase domain protein (plasmid) [Gemmatirosa kalamazoonensis]|uniref:histidine kinase n=1 Tax=Gemmatirosa kalamazoonensis TaxID=861299 RepID=W0RSE0_9BACT|nr:ATP-binding region ATPase domain protein [Gemmatirosa kalamazoonensis]